MSSRKKQRKNLEYISERWQDGKLKEKLMQSKPPQDNVGNTLSPIQLELDLFETQLSTPESGHSHHNQTSIVKSHISQDYTQEQQLLKTLALDSIANEKTFKPYWNESCAAMSKQLLLHTKIDSPDLASICANGCVTSSIVKSWFSMKQSFLQKQKWFKIFWQSSTASGVDYMDLENIKLRSKKIKIYPCAKLKIEWNKWLAACRYCFNQAIAYQKENGRIAKLKLRNIIMQSALPDWVKETPCHIRQNAIFDAHQAYTKSKDCKFRSCKAPRQTIKFNNSNFKQGKWYYNKKKNLDFVSSEPIPQSTEYATQLIRVKSGDWYGVFLEPIKEEKAKAKNQKIIALDPGVRTFLTGFDGNSFIDIGNGDIGRITRLCQHLDKLMSKISLSKSKQQRQKMRKAAAKSREKIRNLIDECHKKVAHWLTQNYEFILLPQFETSDMTKKKKRKLRSKTVRNMLTWAHYRFKTILKNQAELSGCYVIDVTEEFTSQTCSKCGHIHQKLSGNKKFKCPECGHTLPRDWNGAFNILLKALRDTSIVIDNDAIVVKCGDLSRFTA